MRNLEEIAELLDQLDEVIADELEAQDLDFKEWNTRSHGDMIKKVVEMAVCMANGGGGTVVFGVRDRVIGRDKALIGVPIDVDTTELQLRVYDSTEPKITPLFEELFIQEGSGRVMVMQVHRHMALHTDTSGGGKVRIGKDCKPLTGTLRQDLLAAAGQDDYSATTIPGAFSGHISAAAIEELRETARRERGAPSDLLDLPDDEFVRTLDLVQNGELTRAGLLLCGKTSSIREHLPKYVWTYVRMTSDTDYDDRIDGHSPLMDALERVLQRIMANNPITTVKQGLFHFEYRRYPEIALREALLNAFSHANYRHPGVIMIKQFPDCLEISNPGSFIGGVSPENILHHTSVPRNRLLVSALVRLRLVNRTNLGVPRMFEALLAEGKEPPQFEQVGELIRVTFPSSEFSLAFKGFVEEESTKGVRLNVDRLLVLNYLAHHPEIDSATGAHICQRTEAKAREILSKMEVEQGYLERGGTGRGTYWRLRPSVSAQLDPRGFAERDHRLDWEAAKTRILSVLRERAARGDEGLSNAEVRRITLLNRYQTTKLLNELCDKEAVDQQGKGRLSRWFYAGNSH